MNSLVLSVSRGPSVGNLDVEVVERKGLGHPDSICDALAENLSQTLSHYYLDHFGSILHHNVDKVLLVGGSSSPRFGGGEITEPIRIFLAGRAVDRVGEKIVPLQDLALESVRDWFRKKLPHLDPYRHLSIQCLLRPGSGDLVDLFGRGSSVPLSNDTSIGVGFAPMTTLETTLLALERELNTPHFKRRFPETGADIKIMGVRQGDRLGLTLSCAFVDRFVWDLPDYFQKRERLTREIENILRAHTPLATDVRVNTADGDTSQSLYLTVTGTSAESGDDGQVGRGNRANGLITPYRPMTLEAAAGKNPRTHTGKLYQASAQRIASRVVALVEVREAECYLVSRIGNPLNEPLVIDVRLRLLEGLDPRDLRSTVEEIVSDEMALLPFLWKDYLAGDLTVF